MKSSTPGNILISPFESFNQFLNGKRDHRNNGKYLDPIDDEVDLILSCCGNCSAFGGCSGLFFIHGYLPFLGFLFV